MRRFVAVCVAFVVCSASAPLLARLPDGTRGTAYIALHLVLSALMFLSVAWFPSGPRALRWLLLAGVVARSVVALAPPFTSNDAFRYLWDGHLLWHGVDPWGVSPESISTTDWPLPPDNRNIASLYPPLAMGLFALVALAGPTASLWLWKGLVLLAGLGVLLGVHRLVRGSPAARWLPLVALSPLLVLEAGVGAHLDVLVALAVVLSLLAWRHGAFVLGGMCLGAAVLLKFLPLVALLPLTIASGLRAGVRAAAGAGLVIALGYALPFSFGLSPLGSLARFLTTWRFGTPIALLESLGHASILSAAVLLLLLGLSAVRARQAGLDAALPLALIAPLIASPVAFPWYLAPVVAVSATAPSALVLTWATLAPLTYEVIDTYRSTGQFQPATWPLWVTTLGLVAAVVVDARRNATLRHETVRS